MLAGYPFIFSNDKQADITGLPWQIDSTAGGLTVVFGLTIGKSKLGDAEAVLGDDNEMAIVAQTGEPGSLEMYYGHYRTGLLSGKMVLQAEVDEILIQDWQQRAVKTEHMATGKAKKYILSSEDKSKAMDEVIAGITFIPAVNLDEQIIIARFGKPKQRIENNGAIHFLYPEFGLDIALHDEAKEVLQYVAPASFQKLSQPLTE